MAIYIRAIRVDESHCTPQPLPDESFRLRQWQITSAVHESRSEDAVEALDKLIMPRDSRIIFWSPVMQGLITH